MSNGSRPGNAAYPTWVRWLTAIRLDEVLVLQGPPLLGLALGAARQGFPPKASLVVFLAASSSLIAHVFALNDWSEMREELAARGGLERREMLGLSTALIA
ncbi:MAG TPA: hypothetical protein VGR00_11460, partial [Thermoanaerobaculia bacterium]|nr:hypothetical protein [Thermoanaerobaculia bacterium]